jgi:hypothetical protein
MGVVFELEKMQCLFPTLASQLFDEMLQPDIVYLPRVFRDMFEPFIFG